MATRPARYKNRIYLTEPKLRDTIVTYLNRFHGAHQFKWELGEDGNLRCSDYIFNIVHAMQHAFNQGAGK